jgi:hypothetical protein
MWWLVYLGELQKLHPSEGSHGAFIIATIARDTRVTYISLAARNSAARQLCKLQIFGIFGSPAAYKLFTCQRQLGILQLGFSAAWQLGSFAARQIDSSAARQLGRFLKFDGFII